ncbi:MAG: hypothetical protein ACREJ3_02770 [Polyangiaceae bacterium]
MQAWDPEHPAVALAALHDVDTFAERELRDRHELAYPPFTRAALVRVEAVDASAARSASARLAQIALDAPAARDGRVLVQGPAPAPIARLRNRWRFRVMLRAVDRRPLRAVLAVIEDARAQLPRGVRCAIDVDPVQLL